MSTSTHYNLVNRTNNEVKGNIPIHYMTYYEGPIDVDFTESEETLLKNFINKTDITE
ncbi:unnamed protein product, partial [Rotaria magnacalcarata]